MNELRTLFPQEQAARPKTLAVKSACPLWRERWRSSAIQDASDMELLREYQLGSDAAFAEVVRRQVNLVYSVALRHVGHTAQAQEITQAVFVILARNSARLRIATVLEGWLHQTTRLTSLRCLRTERRRQFREHEAYMRLAHPSTA